MTDTPTAPEPSLADLHQVLKELSDLFRRRLLDDRVKTSLIQNLATELDSARGVTELSILMPMARQLILLIDRIEGADSADELVKSITDELIDILEVSGFEPSPTSGPVDTKLHEVIEVLDDPTTGELVIHGTLRRGFAHGTTVIRPGQVIARRVAAE